MKRRNKMKLVLKTFIVLAGLSCFWLSSCKDDDNDSNDFEFRQSCLDISGELCDNYYGETGGTQADCEGPGGTFSTSKCSADNYLGVCTIDFGSLGYTETVYYDNQPPGVNPEAECSLLGGTWSDTYTP